MLKELGEKHIDGIKTKMGRATSTISTNAIFLTPQAGKCIIQSLFFQV